MNLLISRKKMWCEVHLDYDSTKVIFIDETSIIWGSHLKRLIKLISETLPLKKYAKRVNAWRAIATGGKLLLKLFTQTMDAYYYISITNESFKGMKSLGIKGWVLQIGNDPINKSTKVKYYLKKIIDCPLYSPYLSTTENIWS